MASHFNLTHPYPICNYILDIQNSVSLSKKWKFEIFKTLFDGIYNLDFPSQIYI